MLEVQRRILAKEIVLERAQSSAEAIVRKFENLEIGGKTITAPYWKNFRPGLKGTSLYYVVKGGKLSPSEIVDSTVAKARERGLNLEMLNTQQLLYFMKLEGIGVDCSGFAYQIVRAAYEGLGGKEFDNKIAGLDGTTGISRVNAKALTSRPNSFKIDNLADIKPGDLIRSFGGSHAIVVIGQSSGTIRCAHSYESGRDGVQRFNISIQNPSPDIFHQNWDAIEEPIERYDSQDGLWRLKILDGVCGFNLLPQ